MPIAMKEGESFRTNKIKIQNIKPGSLFLHVGMKAPKGYATAHVKEVHIEGKRLSLPPNTTKYSHEIEAFYECTIPEQTRLDNKKILKCKRRKM